MIKAVLLAFALAFTVSSLPTLSQAAPLAGLERTQDDLSSARKKARTARRTGRRAARRTVRRATVGAAAAGGAATMSGGQQQGASVCGGDARRLCRSVLNQGDFAVLQCFQARARFLSRGCRALLQSHGQL